MDWTYQILSWFNIVTETLTSQDNVWLYSFELLFKQKICCGYERSSDEPMWATWNFQQCGMCDQQIFRPVCAYAQLDQSLCLSLEYFTTVLLLTENNLEFLSLNGGHTGLFDSINAKMPQCWKSHLAAHVLTCLMILIFALLILLL